MFLPPPSARAPSAPTDSGAEPGIGSAAQRARWPGQNGGAVGFSRFPLLFSGRCRSSVYRLGGKFPALNRWSWSQRLNLIWLLVRRSGPGLAFLQGAANVKQMYQ